MPLNRELFITFLLFILFTSLAAKSQQNPSKKEVLTAMRKAAQFYANKVAAQGGYHVTYSEDLRYSSSAKGGKGKTQVSATVGATPLVALAFLQAWQASNDKYYLEAARAAAHAMVKGQMCSGGWDYTMHLDPEDRKNYRYRIDNNCGEQAPDSQRNMTNLDNNTTQAVLRMMMRIDRALGFKDKKIHDAVVYALDSLIRAQYPNGAWPQRYEKFHDPALFPVKPASFPDTWSRKWPGYIFYSHYTFNDDAIINMIDVMLEAARIYNEPKYQASAEKAGDFIILAQMPEPQPAWAQQYDPNMHPAWARSCEPPAVTSRESVSTMKGLLLLYKETGKKKYLDPIPRAVDYLKRSSWIRDARPVMARFYEQKTNRPLYITKGTRIGGKRSAGHISKKTNQPFDEYQVTYSDESIIAHYSLVVGAESLDLIRAEYERLLNADPATLKRPDKLQSLTPVTRGTHKPVPPKQLAQKVHAAIDSLDHRGAWVQPGSIEGPDLVISLIPANDMVVTIGEKVMPLKEDQKLAVYENDSQPCRRVIHSGTFAANIRLFANYLIANKQN